MSTEVTTSTQTLTIELTRTGEQAWRDWEAYEPNYDRTGYGATPEEAVRDLLTMLRQLRDHVAQVQATGLRLSDEWLANLASLNAVFAVSDAPGPETVQNPQSDANSAV